MARGNKNPSTATKTPVPRGAGEARETQGVRGAGVAQETQGVQGAGEARETREILEAREAREESEEAVEKVVKWNGDSGRQGIVVTRQNEEISSKQIGQSTANTRIKKTTLLIILEGSLNCRLSCTILDEREATKEVKNPLKPS